MVDTMTIRPMLRPGTSLLRRDATHLQIGTSPGFIVQDQPGLLTVLRLIDGVREVGSIIEVAREFVPEFRGDLGEVLRELCAADLAFDATQWSRRDRGHLDGETLALALKGVPATQLDHRTRFTVSFIDDRGCEEMADLSANILRRAGIGVSEDDEADLLVFLSNGEPARQKFEPLMAGHRPHTRVVLEDGCVRIGPLVCPGATPCINCHDLHRSDWDNAWPALMTQFGSMPTHGLATVLSSTILYHAASDLAAEVIAYCDGTAVQTEGHCLMIGPGTRDQVGS